MSEDRAGGDQIPGAERVNLGGRQRFEEKVIGLAGKVIDRRNRLADIKDTVLGRQTAVAQIRDIQARDQSGLTNSFNQLLASRASHSGIDSEESFRRATHRD